MTDRIRSFEDLRIWQKGIEIVTDVYTITKKFPNTELYGLVSQMRRCAISIPSNIAEGFKRQHAKEYKQFLYIALGSCGELETQIIISAKLEYINDESFFTIRHKITYLSKMITTLRRKLK